MARALGSLVLQLQADTKRLERDLGRANSRVKRLEGAMRGSAKRINSALAGIGAGLSVGIFASQIKQAITFGDEIQKTALRTGLTTEAISELSFVAERGGSSLEAIIKATQKVQRASIDASDGLKTYTRAFDRLGIDVEEFKKLAPDKQFELVADSISKLENPTERTAVAMQLLGRQGAELISVFAGGAGEIAELRDQAKRLGVSLSQDAADRAAEAEDRITDLKTALRGASLTTANDMIPAISALAAGFQEVLLPTISAVTTGFVNLGQFIGGVAAAILSDGLTIKEVFEDLQTRFDNLKPPASIKIPVISPLGADGLLDEGDSNDPETPRKPRKSAAQRAAETSAGIIVALQEELTLSKALTEEEKFRVSLTQGRFKDLVGADKALGAQLANEIRAADALAEKRQAALDLERERESLAESVIAGLEKQVATYNLTTEAAKIRFELEEGAYKSLDGLSKARIESLSRELETLEKATQAAEEAKQKQEDAAKRAADTARDFGNVFSSAFEDAIIGGNSFSDVIKGLEQDLIRMTARLLITVPLQNALAGAFSGSGLSSFFGGPKADGGPVSPGRAYLVGEKGPELFMPKQAGTIIPNGAGGVTVNVIVQGATDADSFNRNRGNILAGIRNGMAAAAARNN